MGFMIDYGHSKSFHLKLIVQNRLILGKRTLRILPSARGRNYAYNNTRKCKTLLSI
jgi:hypothetical protein